MRAGRISAISGPPRDVWAVTFTGGGEGLGNVTAVTFRPKNVALFGVKETIFFAFHLTGGSKTAKTVPVVQRFKVL